MPLVGHFTRRMGPLAALAGVVIALAPPLMFHAVAWKNLRGQARIYAGQIAQGLSEAVFQQPRLWRYNAAKILKTAVYHLDQEDITSVHIHDCRGENVLPNEPDASDPALGARGMLAPRGYAIVEVWSHRAALVSVQVDPSGHWLALLLISGASICLGAFTGCLLFLFPTRVVRRQSRTLAKTNEALTQRVDEAVNTVRDLSKRVIQTQEEERQRIARDLHDGLGQAITGLQMQLELALAQKDELEARVANSIAICSNTLAELRRVVQEVRPPELEAEDLPEALRTYTELFEHRTGITTYYHARGDSTCSAEVAVCVFRLLQEALTNVARHAQASEVGVRLICLDSDVMLEVADDGIGFDSHAPTHGSGLRGMGERCAFLGGTMQVRSSAKEGTTILFTLPFDGRSKR